MTCGTVHAESVGLEGLISLEKHGHALVPANPSGIVTARIELSALPETRSFEVGLNRSTVGGKSCAFSTDKRGWWRGSE